MADTYDSSQMTSAPARAVHAGLNAVAVVYARGATLSGTATINLLKLPRGARVIGGSVRHNAAGQGDAADKLVIKDNEGNVYCDTAVAADLSAGASFLGDGLGNRITGSAHVYATGFFKATTGTSAPIIRVMCTYLADDEGD